jgi:beta-lactamase regulating signal transducer with metallopeptidase domain
VETILQIGLSNAFAATVLAVLAAAVGSLCRRPALVHSLWLLVLLKLVTPPLVSVPIPWLARPDSAAQEAKLLAVPIEIADTGSGGEDNLQSSEEGTQLGTDEAFPATRPASLSSVENVESGTSADNSDGFLEQDKIEAGAPIILGHIQWGTAVLSLSLTGSVLWFVLTVVRVWRFRALLRRASLAPSAVREEAQRVAVSLGLKDCPGVFLVPGSIPPLLWALAGPARLFVPKALWERLNSEQRVTLLAHELAHLRRGDHWIRLFELAARGLYWWHPVVWWASRELREAEEQCCDAWVVWALPKAARAYATALVETVDFLSETPTAMPLAASGMGHVHDLRRRLTMIMRGSTPRMLSGTGLLAVLALRALSLPLLPTWAQPPAPRNEAGEQEEKQRAVEQERQRLQAELVAQRARAEQANVQEATERMKQQVEQMRAQVEQAKARLDQATKQLERAQRQLKELDQRREAAQPDRPGEAARARPPARATGGAGSGRGPGFGGMPGGAMRAGAPPGSPAEQDRRLGEVERKLDALLEEVQSLRREMQRSRSGALPGRRGGGDGDGSDRPNQPGLNRRSGADGRGDIRPEAGLPLGPSPVIRPGALMPPTAARNLTPPTDLDAPVGPSTPPRATPPTVREPAPDTSQRP